MDEKKLMDRIKESADGMDAPESLKPEQIEDMVRGVEQKKKRLPVYRIGAAAAAVLLVLVAIWQIPEPGRPVDIGEMTREAPEETESAVLSAQTKEDGTKETEAGAGGVADTEKVSQGEVIAHVASEEALYQALASMIQPRSMDAGLGAAYTSGTTDAVAKDVVVDAEAGAIVEEVAEEAVEDTGAGIAESSDSYAPGTDFSETNLQELGVDEGDIIKTDGNYIYVLSGDKVRIIEAHGAEMTLVGEIEPSDKSTDVQEMYVDGDFLNLITTESSSFMEQDGEEKDVYRISSSGYTRLSVYDISDRSAPRLSGSVAQEGYYSTSRKNGDMIYLFTEYDPVIRETREASRYLPKAGEEQLGIEDIYLPEYAAQSGYLVISSIDMKKPDQVLDHKAIVSAASQYYVSTENIYISNCSFENGRDVTQILKFSYRDGKIEPAATGEIRGYLNDSFSMNEYHGYLRTVATDWNDGRELTHLYVLDENLDICGKIADIAPGESVRSARFFGYTGYFVTFRDTDPLFSVDLSDPEKPEILGELKVTGFSSYLHFYGEDKLLGIGNEVDPDTGEYQGIKISMFDISDPSDVKEMDRYVIKDTYDCPGLYNYKAILVNPEKNILGFECDNKYMVFSWQEGKGFVNEFISNNRDEDGKERYLYNMRGIYIGDIFYLSEDKGIRAFDMQKDFEETGSLRY